MTEEVSPEIIQSTQKLLGKHVTKPQLTEKLLRKPPFRFLHDIIVHLVRGGFLKGLYTDDELISDNIKDRDSKISFLNKLITAVKYLSHKDLQVKSSKIIAGLDATETNRLLQNIAKLIDDKVDTREYVKNLKKIAKNGKKVENVLESAPGHALEKNTSKSSVTKKIAKLEPSRKKLDKKASSKGSEDASPKLKVSPAAKKGIKAVTKTGKTESLEKTSSRSSITSKDGNSKPIKASISKSYPKDKAQSKEMANVSTTKTSSKVSPRKDLKNSADENIEVHAIEEPMKVSKLLEDPGKPHHDELLSSPTNFQQTKPNEEIVDLVSVTSQDRIIESDSHVKQPSARPKSARPRNETNDRPISGVETNVIVGQGKTQNPIKKRELPSGVEISNLSSKTFTGTGNTIPAKDSVIDLHDSIIPAQGTKPKSALLRPPSVRPSSARPGAPRLRSEAIIPMKEIVPLGKINVIVENFDAQQASDLEDEEETVVIESVPDDVRQYDFIENNINLDMPAAKGHLVEQILEQMQDDGQEEAMQFEWEHEGSKNKDAATKEINALQASVQALTKTANPLGKLVSYLHDDMEAMHSELQTWSSMKKQYMAEIVKQKRVNNKSNQPLIQQLHNLEESIKHEHDEIATIKYNILQNDERIRHLVSKQILVDK